MSNRIAKLTVINLIPVVFMALNLLELYDWLLGNVAYPFESEFFFKNSIYSSRGVYLAFIITMTLSLALLIFCSIKGWWKTYFLLLTLNLLLILYPIVTND